MRKEINTKKQAQRYATKLIRTARAHRAEMGRAEIKCLGIRSRY